MALEDFAASVQQEGKIGEDAFKPESEQDEQVATPAPSPSEKQTGKEAASPQAANTGDDNNLPFHKHPRWIERERELRDLRDFKEQYAPKIDQVTEYLAKNLDQPETPPIPDWFSGLYGKDQTAWSNYLQQEAGIRAQIKNEVIQELEAKSQAEIAEKERWSGWVNDSLQELEDEGLKFDKVELQETALKYLPTDLDGNIDFRKAYDIMQELNRAKTLPQAAQVTARKAIADMTTGKPRAEKAAPQFETNRSLRNKTFDRLVHDSN